MVSGLADLEAYGQLVLANPDFLTRLRTSALMNDADPRTFFGGGAEGHVDYHLLREASAV